MNKVTTKNCKRERDFLRSERDSSINGGVKLLDGLYGITPGGDDTPWLQLHGGRGAGGVREGGGGGGEE
jgi:hypothetical protein